MNDKDRPNTSIPTRLQIIQKLNDLKKDNTIKIKQDKKEKVVTHIKGVFPNLSGADLQAITDDLESYKELE